MKTKLLFLSLLAINSVNASPLNGETSHHEGGTITNHFEEYNVPMPDWMKKNLQSKSASTQATANPASGVHNQNVTASGNVSYQIYNSSPTTQNYWIDKYMCITSSCTHVRDTLTLGSHLNSNGNAMLYVTAFMPTPGSYQDSASIQVSGIDNSTATGYNKVVIS